jgi:hypothetical protein
MKANLKKLIGLAALGMSLLTNTVPAWSGTVRTEKVSVEKLGSQFVHAWGTLVGARYSKSRGEFIGCSVEARVNEPPIIGCGARDGAGRSVSCSSVDPVYVDQVQRMTDSSYIYFKVHNDIGICQILEIRNFSDGLK